MSIEFKCGTTIKNVGMPSLAIKVHLFHHPEDTLEEIDCIQDCKTELPKYKDFIVDVN